MSPLAKEQGIPAHRQLNLVCIMHLTALSQVLTASPAHWRPSQLATWRLPSLRQFVDGRTITQSCPSAGNSEQRHPAARQQQPCALAASSGYPEGSPGQQVQRALGLDYGRRVVGLAVSTLGLAPRPLDGVPGCASAADVLATAQAVLEVAMRERCDAIVVGLPVTSTGSLRRRDTDSQQGRRCRNFASTLASLAEPRGLRVFLADERGSTLEARQVLEASGSRRSTFSRRKDSVSAAVILTTFFDNPREAVRVKPWRPPGAADGKRPHRVRQSSNQQQAQQQQGQQQEQAQHLPAEHHQPHAAEQQAAGQS